jgi:leucyl/phenylalanyl-tRNA--protein transferase
MSAMTVWSEPVSGGNDPAGRDAVIFSEALRDRLERIALGTAWALQPKRIGALPALARLWLTDLVAPQRGLPDPQRTVNAMGLCGMVHAFSPAVVLAAYRHGLFAFAHFGPLKWFSPGERCVLYFDEFHIGKQVRRLLRQGCYCVTFDRDFAGVIKACAGRRKGRWHVTWITPRIMRVFYALYEAGDAHSFEVWNAAGELVGGGYGLALGGVFFTESQFSRESNTSKLGFTVLNWHLAQWGFHLNDGKWPTPTITEMGFRSIPRRAFLDHIADAAAVDARRGRWQVETDLKTIAAWEPGAANGTSIVPSVPSQRRSAHEAPSLAPDAGEGEPDKAAIAATKRAPPAR